MTTAVNSCHRLPFISLNARSLFHKMDELRSIVNSSETRPHIISVTESWSCAMEPDSFYQISGYTLHRFDRTSTVGGGSVLYINDFLRSDRLFKTDTPLAGESVWANVTTGNTTIAVGSIYCPPSTDSKLFCHELDLNILSAKEKADHVLLLGDFNAKNTSWYSADKTDIAGDNLQCLFATHNLQQLVDFPTHIYCGVLKSCLDLVVTSFSSHAVRIGSSPPLGASDHLVVTGSLKVQTNFPQNPTPQAITYRRWKWSENAISALRQALSVANLQPPTAQALNPNQVITSA